METNTNQGETKQAIPLEFRTATIENQQHVFVTSPWPAKSVAAAAILKADSPFIRLGADHVVTFLCANGEANYTMTAGDVLVDLELREGSAFEEPPAEGAEKAWLDAKAARVAAELAEAEKAKGGDNGEQKPAADEAQRPLDARYDGPAVGEHVRHQGVAREVVETLYTAAGGSQVKFGDGVYVSVNDIEAIEEEAEVQESV